MGHDALHPISGIPTVLYGWRDNVMDHRQGLELAELLAATEAPSG